MKLKYLRRFPAEFTGSLGDLGTFLPLACGLIMINKVNGASLFLVAGIIYIAAGIYFRIPMPVQPLKATSALAMAIGAAASTISVVALFMSVFLFVITFFRLDKLMARVFTRPIIRGIQLGLAIILVKTGFKLILGRTAHCAVPTTAGLDLSQAFFLLFLPQLPLTLANSIYATADTAKIYFREKAGKVTPRALIISLSIANLIAGCIGAIPLCHGSSGVTAHYRFGARNGLSGICIGSLFILIAFTFFSGSGMVIKLIPFRFLGFSLIYIGIRHGLLISDIIFLPEELSVALIVGAYTFISGNLAIGFLIGIGTNFIFKIIPHYLNERKNLPTPGVEKYFLLSKHRGSEGLAKRNER